MEWSGMTRAEQLLARRIAESKKLNYTVSTLQVAKHLEVFDGYVHGQIDAAEVERRTGHKVR